jgi:hypothetical protein
MRTLFGLTLTLAFALLLGHADDARAQGTYNRRGWSGQRYTSSPRASGSYSRGYNFADEPVMSINRSYLGYSNFVDPGPRLPAHADPPGPNSATTRALGGQAPGFVRAPAPARRGFRLFRWRR